MSTYKTLCRNTLVLNFIFLISYVIFIYYKIFNYSNSVNERMPNSLLNLVNVASFNGLVNI